MPFTGFLSGAPQTGGVNQLMMPQTITATGGIDGPANSAGVPYTNVTGTGGIETPANDNGVPAPTLNTTGGIDGPANSAGVPFYGGTGGGRMPPIDPRNFNPMFTQVPMAGVGGFGQMGGYGNPFGQSAIYPMGGMSGYQPFMPMAQPSQPTQAPLTPEPPLQAPPTQSNEPPQWATDLQNQMTNLTNVQNQPTPEERAAQYQNDMRMRTAMLADRARTIGRGTAPTQGMPGMFRPTGALGDIQLPGNLGQGQSSGLPQVPQNPDVATDPNTGQQQSTGVMSITRAALPTGTQRTSRGGSALLDPSVFPVNDPGRAGLSGNRRGHLGPGSGLVPPVDSGGGFNFSNPRAQNMREIGPSGVERGSRNAAVQDYVQKLRSGQNPMARSPRGGSAPIDIDANASRGSINRNRPRRGGNTPVNRNARNNQGRPGFNVINIGNPPLDRGPRGGSALIPPGVIPVDPVGPTHPLAGTITNPRDRLPTMGPNIGLPAPIFFRR